MRGETRCPGMSLGRLRNRLREPGEACVSPLIRAASRPTFSLKGRREMNGPIHPAFFRTNALPHNVSAKTFVRFRDRI